MANIDSAITELKEMDDLAALDSPIHNLHPLVKLLTTISYIFITASFEKYDLTRLMIMLLYPVLLFAVSGIPLKTCFHKLRFVLPLVCAVGLFNPFFDRQPLLILGEITISGGVISMITLMFKGVFCLMASFIFVATTPVDAICAALRKLHVPSLLVTLFLLTYRYVGLMIKEVSIMMTAYTLRAPGQKGVHYKAWGAFLGQLILRSMDRAEELYSSMQLRGFNGEFFYAETQKTKFVDWAFCICAISAFFIFRNCDIAQLLGSLVV